MRYLQGLLWGILLSAISDAALAEPLDAEPLRVKPNRCIALHQGQYCYQTLNFSWTTEAQHRYCLYIQDEPGALVCWDANRLSQYRHEFKGVEDQWFVLRDETEQRVLGEVKVDVAWVYKSSKKVSTGWRLF